MSSTDCRVLTAVLICADARFLESFPRPVQKRQHHLHKSQNLLEELRPLSHIGIRCCQFSSQSKRMPHATGRILTAAGQQDSFQPHNAI